MFLSDLFICYSVIQCFLWNIFNKKLNKSFKYMSEKFLFGKIGQNYKNWIIISYYVFHSNDCHLFWWLAHLLIQFSHFQKKSNRWYYLPIVVSFQCIRSTKFRHFFNFIDFLNDCFQSIFWPIFQKIKLNDSFL